MPKRILSFTINGLNLISTVLIALLAQLDENGNVITDAQGNIALDPAPDWQPNWIKTY